MARQRSAKPFTAVRIRSRPPTKINLSRTWEVFLYHPKRHGSVSCKRRMVKIKPSGIWRDFGWTAPHRIQCQLIRSRPPTKINLSPTWEVFLTGLELDCLSSRNIPFSQVYFFGFQFTIDKLLLIPRPRNTVFTNRNVLLGLWLLFCSRSYTEQINPDQENPD